MTSRKCSECGKRITEFDVRNGLASFCDTCEALLCVDCEDKHAEEHEETEIAITFVLEGEQADAFLAGLKEIGLSGVPDDVARALVEMSIGTQAMMRVREHLGL